MRFNYDEIYSFKLFNIRGYMSEILNKVEKEEDEKRIEKRASPEARHEEREEMKARNKALGGMETSQNPERGKGHILITSVTEEVFRTVSV